MRLLLTVFSVLLLASGCAVQQAGPRQNPRRVLRAEALPLALSDAFAFRKQSISFYDPASPLKITSEPVLMEERRITYGAVTRQERQGRAGHYFRFWWRAGRRADLTVRLEYRQENLGAYVQAQELQVPAAEGTMETRFQVAGDDFNQEGRVTAWRVLLIENGKIIALRQSFLWY